jgi:HEAT repeat protein
LLLAAPASQPAPSQPPDLDTILYSAYGDAQNVKLLEGLLADPDPVTRQEAVLDLSQTHNELALPLISGAMADQHHGVRAAAVMGAAQFDPALSSQILVQGLADKDAAVLLAALRTAASMRLPALGPQIVALLDNADPLVVSTALETLSSLASPAPVDKLKKLLASPSPAVALRAAQNAMLLTDAHAIADEIAALASSPDGACHGAALAAIGKFCPDKLALLDQAKASPDPLVRTGAALGYQFSAQRAPIKAMLDDPSPMVRLAAIKAAGALKCEDCTDKLLQIMLSAPEDWEHFPPASSQSHLAARESLRQIGTDAVVNAAAAIVAQLPAKLDQAAKVEPGASAQAADETAKKRKKFIPRGPEQQLQQRNAASACWILGQLKSPKALPDQVKILSDYSVHLPMQAQSIQAMGLIGDKSAASPLIAALGQFRTDGQAYVDTLAAQQPPPPFSHRNAQAAIEALGELKAADAWPAIKAIVGVKAKGLRLNGPATMAMRVAPQLIGADNRKTAEQPVADVVADANYGITAQYEAILAAGKLKLADVLPAIHEVMTNQRPCWAVLKACQWATYQISGQASPITEPVVSQGHWIIRKSDK